MNVKNKMQASSAIRSMRGEFRHSKHEREIDRRVPPSESDAGANKKNTHVRCWDGDCKLRVFFISSLAPIHVQEGFMRLAEARALLRSARYSLRTRCMAMRSARAN